MTFASSSAPSDYDIEDDPSLLIRRILAHASTAVNAQPRGIDGPTESQWRPLHCLYLLGSLRVIDLARVCEIDPAGMTRLIDRLERKGFCRRSRSPSDRRVVEVLLTERGAESTQRVAPALEHAQHKLLADFDAAQRKNLLQLLARLRNYGRADSNPAVALLRLRYRAVKRSAISRAPRSRTTARFSSCAARGRALPCSQ